MAGDLKAKHVEWNSRLITKYVDSFVTMPIGIVVSFMGRTLPPLPYNPSATPDNLDIAIK